MKHLTRLLAALTVAALLRGCEARAAPAPFPRTARPQKPEPIAGEYLLYFGGHTYLMTLSPCGTYAAHGPDGTWRGTWKLDGDVLDVSETDRPDGVPHVFWRMPLKCERIRRLR